MAVDPLILIANPGSASRKYALYEGDRPRAHLHFEYFSGKVICTVQHNGSQHTMQADVTDLSGVPARIITTLQANGLLRAEERISHIGLRVVAPSAYFLEDHDVTDDFVARLEAIEPRAPLHIKITLEEFKELRSQFADVPILGVSDSAFHMTKPDYVWNYGISIEDADRYEIKRYGYHGLSVSSVVHSLAKAQKLPAKLIVCHLGSGASVTAVRDGKSIDTTMGYSPLEGVVMATRCGDIDPTAVRALKEVFHFDDNGVEDYLNNHSGLLGLGGSSDIRELLRREGDGDHRSHLALQTYTYSVQKAIGQMVAALEGVDMLVFVGTVGERSMPMRERIISHLHYLDFFIDDQANNACDSPNALACISRLVHSKPIFVAPAREAAEIARHTLSHF
jgi:acetate kinase